MKKVPLARKILNTNHLHAAKEVKTKLNNKTPVRTDSLNKNAPLTGPKFKTGTTSTSSASKPTAAPLNNLVKNLHNKNNVNSASSKPKSGNTATTNLKPRSLKMPPPSTVPAKKSIAAAGPSKNIRKIDVPTIKITGPAVVKPKFQSAARRTTEGPARTMQRFNNKSPQQHQKNARLTQVMKAKKPQKPPSGTSTKLLSLMVSQTNGLMTEVVQTPKDFSSSNHFDDFVTSTKVKNASQTMEEIEGVSPIEMLPKRPSGTTSAKRNLLKEATTKALATTQSNEIKENNKPSVSENPTRKFNFIRYSEINISINGEEDEEVKKDVENVEEEEKEPPPKSPDNQNNRTIQNSMHEERTPTKQSIASDDKPVNYLSPFVSVSRGKVSLKKEKEKRNSVYLVNHNEEDGLDSTIQQQEKVSSPHVSPVASEPKSPQYSAEVRRTLEAVRYFRKQLQDEIDRLHKECDIWEEYKSENLEKLQTANCDDMIDVTIGQTRLLTSKKFMQFKGLIDRCEARATGIGDVPNDGSEKTKDVSAEDLEGFWSMLGLQVDNLEKRFENLNRWKGNDWRDPDEVIPKAKTKPKNLTKVKKSAPVTKAKPNSALQQMLRRMQADMRTKKANNLLATTDDVVLTPSKVRDRKYFSPAATVVAIPASNRRLSLLRQNSLDSPNRRMSLLAQDSPNRRMSLLARKNSQDSPSRRMSLMPRKNSHDSPSLLKSVLQFREAFDATLVEENNSCGTKRSSVNGKNCTESPRLSSTKMQTDNEAFNSPVVKQRKSILKTPCSAVTRLRNVVFNQKLRVKKFNFITNDGDAIDNSSDEDCNKSTEEDMPPTRQGNNLLPI